MRPRIGCAGWSIGTDQRGMFGNGASLLACYSTRFNAVEINSSFYRPHMLKTYQRWAVSVPIDFRFSVKMPKTITHGLRLQNTTDLIDRFLAEVSGLGEKLGGLLIQLPPSLAFDTLIASTFFSLLHQRTSVPLACEARHPSWFTSDAEEILTSRNVTRVAANPTLIPEANDVAGGGAWRYWRWHGSPRMYYSNYSDASLLELSKAIADQTPAGVEPWIIFDNTANGYAIPNAMSLQSIFDTAAAARKQKV